MFSYQHFQLKFRNKSSILYVKDQDMEKNSHLCFIGVKLKFVELSVIVASDFTHHPSLAAPAKHTPLFIGSPQEMVKPAPIA